MNTAAVTVTRSVEYAGVIASVLQPSTLRVGGQVVISGLIVSSRLIVCGQVVALPTTMTVFALMGIIITSASAEIYGHPIWDPVELVGKFESRLLVGISMFTVVVATLGVNIAANVVSPANDFANIKPGAISFKTGGLITGIVGILMVPWKRKRRYPVSRQPHPPFRPARTAVRPCHQAYSTRIE